MTPAPEVQAGEQRNGGRRPQAGGQRHTQPVRYQCWDGKANQSSSLMSVNSGEGEVAGSAAGGGVTVI